MAVRRVRRIIRKVDPWTVLRVTLVLNTVWGLVWTLGVWVAWSIAVQRGIPDAFVDTFSRLTIAFTPDGDLYFRVVVMLAIVGVIIATGLMTLTAVLYNLISDVVGGVEIVMLEETVDHPQTQSMPRPVVHVTPTDGMNGRDSTSPSLTSEDTVEST